jgi:hypothetical protein
VTVVRFATLLLAGLLSWGAVARLEAQGSLQVQGVRSLGFGNLLPGVSKQVLPTDPVRSGQFNLSGPAQAHVLLTFTLPASLSGPGGASLPLAFGGSDAGFSADRSIAGQIGFDPTRPYAAVLGTPGRSAVFLGGVAQPGAGQAAGNYTGVVTLTMVIP